MNNDLELWVKSDVTCFIKVTINFCQEIHFKYPFVTPFYLKQPYTVTFQINLP